MRTAKNILYLECRGCYFFENDRIARLSDVGNYRVGVYNNKIRAKNGKEYNNKITGKPLKHPKKEILLENALHISTEFENDRGCWADLTLENKIREKLFTYTRKDILQLFNEISIEQFDKIVMIPSEELIPELPGIYKKGGYREKNILDNLTDIKTVLYNKDYWVLRFTDSQNNSFEYEYYSKRITN